MVLNVNYTKIKSMARKKFDAATANVQTTG